jgi:hypothetical protein
MVEHEGSCRCIFCREQALARDLDEARRLAAEYFAAWWAESDGPAEDPRIWHEQMAETPWMLDYLKPAEARGD